MIPKAGAQSRASSLLTHSRVAGPSAVRQSVDIVGILGQVAYEVGEVCQWREGPTLPDTCCLLKRHTSSL